MASNVRNAALGKRGAMQALYESNKQKVFFASALLLQDQKQAATATAAAFRAVWPELYSTGIQTEAAFTAFVLEKAVSHCKNEALKRNPKAFRVPSNKDFTIPEGLRVNDSFDAEWAFLCANLPTTQRYILVLRTVCGFAPSRIAQILKLDSTTVDASSAAESDNILRLQHLSSRGFESSCEAIQEAIAQAEADTAVPESVNTQVTASINTLITPVEVVNNQQARKWGLTAVIAGGCVLLALVVGWIVNTVIENSKFLDESLTYYADIEIRNYGTVTVKLDQSAAPITCANFVHLAESGFYDGLTFHRIIEGFMMQGGDPNADGSGGSGESIIGEFSANGYDNPLSHTRGCISMAHANDYDSASSQFFIVQEDSDQSLDGKYAAFGYVIEGMDIVDAICEAAEPVDDNGTILSADQPVITSIKIRTE